MALIPIPTRPGVTVIHASDRVRGVMGKSVEALYAEQPHLQTVVGFMASNIASLPVKCYIRRSDGDRERDTTGPLPLLLADPNPDMTGYDLISASVVEWCLYGRVVWAVGRDASSASGWQARLIPCSWITNKTGSNGFSFSELEFAEPETGAVYTLPTSQCVMFQSYRPGAPTSALSPVESLRQTLAEQIEAQQFRRGVWKNGAQITGYISRPQGVTWTPEAAERFKTDVRDNWTGGGANAGGMPVLEDGMDYHAVEFNAKERDWASGVKLSREDCAAAYHINPSVIWPGDGQTYASAKDNARALYAESLFPVLRMLSERINKTLAPMVGAPAGEYTEFDISVKLQANFEERAAAMQTAVGGPWMTRQEARAQMNMAREPDGDLITPLNVLVGGLASPTDTAPKEGPVVDGEPGYRKGLSHAPACSCDACKALSGTGPAPEGRKASGAPFGDEVGAYRDALASFYARQRKSVLSRMGAKAAPGAGVPDWFDMERWNRELAQDLMGAIQSGSEAAAKRALSELGLDPSLYDAPRTRAFLLALAEARAEAINRATLDQLLAAAAGAVGEGAQGATPAGVFDKAESSRADQQAASIATAVSGWSVLEAARQCAPAGAEAYKTWVTGMNPRKSHLAMNGETVPIGEPFSNGADWPGDSRVLPASQVANCNCRVDITLAGDVPGDVPEWNPEEDVTEYRADNLDVSGLSSREYSNMRHDKYREWQGYVRLSQLGHKQRLLHEDKGASANIDTWIEVGGESHYFDLKTPRKGPGSLNKLLIEGYSKWTRLLEEGVKIPAGLDISKLDVPRIIVDNRFSRMDDGEAENQILDSMKYLTENRALPFREVLLITRDGGERHIEI